jgi:hypothetical protein
MLEPSVAGFQAFQFVRLHKFVVAWPWWNWKDHNRAWVEWSVVKTRNKSDHLIHGRRFSKNTPAFWYQWCSHKRTQPSIPYGMQEATPISWQRPLCFPKPSNSIQCHQCSQIGWQCPCKGSTCLPCDYTSYAWHDSWSHRFHLQHVSEYTTTNGLPSIANT